MAKKASEVLAIVLILFSLALVSTYPLIQHFDTAIPYAPFGGEEVYNRSGDQIQLLYWFWLVKENLTGSVEPFHSNPFEFNMVHPHESSGMNTVPLAFIYYIFSPFGDIAAYNCTIIFSYILTGLFTYLLVKQFTRNRIGALFAASIFTFAPIRIIGIAAGHAFGLLFFCYPFILYFLEKGIREGRILYGIFSGAGLIFLSMVEPHLIYYICIFLAVYIPFRIITLSAVVEHPYSIHAWKSKSVFLSSLMIVLAGCSATFFAQIVFFNRGLTPLLPATFFWALLAYSVLLLLISLSFTVVYQWLTELDFARSLRVEAISYLPLIALLLFIWIPVKGIQVNSDLVVYSVCGAIFFLKVVGLRKHIGSMAKHYMYSMWQNKRRVLPIVPLLFSMLGIVYWMALSKVKQVQSTIAGGGRTLSDVSVFSAELEDLLSSMSSVYIGVIPSVLLVFALLGVFFFAFSRSRVRFVGESQSLFLFFLTIAVGCLILALGLGFGRVSLYALFYHYFPFFNYPRVSDRIISLSLFALAVAIGFLVAMVQRRYKSRIYKGIFTALLSVAIVVQLYDVNVFRPMGVNVLDRGQDIYTYVKKHIGDGRLLEIPFWPGDSHQSSLYQHYIMIDRIPRINGSSPMVLQEYIETVFEPLATINQGRLNAKQHELLQELRVRFITVHDNQDVFLDKVSPFPPITTVRRLQNSPYLEQVHIDNYMHFKTWKKKDTRLYLFRVKNDDEIDNPSYKAWYDMPYFYDLSSRFYLQTGDISVDGDKRVFTAIEGRDKPGFMMYGPYIKFPAGSFKGYFTLHVDRLLNSDSREKRGVRVEVSAVDAKGDVKILASKEVADNTTSDSYSNVYLDFALQKSQIVEFRAYYYGAGVVKIEKVAVSRRGQHQPLYSIEAEKMVGETGRVVSEQGASDGKAVEAIVGRSKPGRMIYGINRVYTPGAYKALFSLRSPLPRDLPEDVPAATIRVTDEKHSTVFAEQTIPVWQLKHENFVDLPAAFTLESEQELSFSVEFHGKAHLQVDKITIVPDLEDSGE